MTVELDDQDRAAFLRHLLKEVATGRLGPDEADERASQAGFGFLSKLIAPDDYWPSSKPYWTVPMVLAWISWRNYSEVREWDRDYLSRRREWGRVVEGATNPDTGRQFKLYRRKAPNSAQFAQWGNKRFGSWAPTEDGQPAVLQACPAEHAASGLLNALAEERLVALANPSRGGDRIPVPISELADIELDVGPSGEDRFCFRHRPKVAVYSDALFSRPAVLSIWPEHSRSGLDERLDISPVTPMVNHAGAREALYSVIEVEEFEPGDGARGSGATMVKWAPRHLDELSRLNERSIRDKGRPLTIRETVSWAKSQGISREGAREMRKVLRERCEAVEGQEDLAKK
jgi:hypothetical protein